MASCTFTLHFDSTADALFTAARAAVVGQGGTFAGTPQQGRAALPTEVGTIHWTYTVQGQNLRIDVTDKPWLVSCGDVQQQMAELVASIPKPTIDTTAEVSAPVAVAPAVVPPAPPFAMPTLSYGLWFIGGTLGLLSLFWLSRRLRWL